MGSMESALGWPRRAESASLRREPREPALRQESASLIVGASGGWPGIQACRPPVIQGDPHSPEPSVHPEATCQDTPVLSSDHMESHKMSASLHIARETCRAPCSLQKVRKVSNMKCFKSLSPTPTVQRLPLLKYPTCEHCDEGMDKEGRGREEVNLGKP